MPARRSHGVVSTSAELIGDVTVGPRCYIGPGAVIRGDAAEIILEEEVAVEDASSSMPAGRTSAACCPGV